MDVTAHTVSMHVGTLLPKAAMAAVRSAVKSLVFTPRLDQVIIS